VEIGLSSGCLEKSARQKKELEMTISAILTLVLGIVLLLFGRRAFWIFVAVAGFIAGLTFATQYLSGQSELVILLIAIGAGVIGAVLAIMLEWLAILIAGFLAGGFLATTLAVSMGVTIASGNWVVYIIGGIIGLILVAALFDWAIIILSVLLGDLPSVDRCRHCRAGRFLASPLSCQAYLVATPIDRIPAQMMMSYRKTGT
jgi:hypothetical protein